MEWKAIVQCKQSNVNLRANEGTPGRFLFFSGARLLLMLPSNFILILLAFLALQLETAASPFPTLCYLESFYVLRKSSGESTETESLTVVLIMTAQIMILAQLSKV